MTKEVQSPNAEGRSGVQSPTSSFGFGWRWLWPFSPTYGTVESHLRAAFRCSWTIAWLGTFRFSPS